MPIAPSADALTLPPGFQARTLPIPRATESGNWVNGLQLPSTLEFEPGGSRIFVAERNGRVMVLSSTSDSTPTLSLDITDEVMAKGDRGLLGMKLDPEYPTKPYIYLLYTYDAPIGGSWEDSTHAHYKSGADDCHDEPPYSDCLVSGRLVRVTLDPATGIAVNASDQHEAKNPPEQVLVNSWCQQFTSHSIGAIEFDSEGALLASGGEGGSWSTTDYGQFGNPCHDPYFEGGTEQERAEDSEGGSLRAQDVRTPATAQDPTDYSGSLIRINRETGAPLPNNPLSQSPVKNAEGEVDEAAKRILAYGFRNPYRFTIQPETGDVYVGNVGQNNWEALDRTHSPPLSGQSPMDFGWPCYEGPGVMHSWDVLNNRVCESLYATPGAVTPPYYSYPHYGLGIEYEYGHLYPGDECISNSGAAIGGLAFYDPTGVNPESAFPVADDGALFIADAARGCIWVMRAGEGGAPDPSTVEDFVVRENGDNFTPVDIVEGPDGALYVPNFYDNSITQIRYFGDNGPPTAKISSDNAFSGTLPMTVHFDASGSSDPDGEELHYEWDLNGDGKFEEGSDQPTAEWEYTTASSVPIHVRVRVTDKLGREGFGGHEDVAETMVYPGDAGPPVPEIIEPSESLEWAIGDTINYAGSATDPDESEASLSAHWVITTQHCPSTCHSHPITEPDGFSGEFVAPQHEYPSHLRLELIVADAQGATGTKTVEVFPRLIQVGVGSEPPGVPLGIGELTGAGPFSVTLIAGGSTIVTAPQSTTIGGVPYRFSSWSDGGERLHQVTSLVSRNLLARYLPEATGGNSSTRGATSRRRVRLELASRPPGVRLQIGRLRKVAPFRVRLPLGDRTFIFAPRVTRKGGALLVFKGWRRNGHRQGSARRRGIVVRDGARYVAIYRAG